MNKLHGKITWVDGERGFGFVRECCPRCGTAPDCGKNVKRQCRQCKTPLRDYFFHVSGVSNAIDRDMIFTADRTHPYVEFVVKASDRGAQATQLKVVQPERKQA